MHSAHNSNEQTHTRVCARLCLYLRVGVLLVCSLTSLSDCAVSLPCVQAVFQVQNVMARSLLMGTWRKTKVTRLLRHAMGGAALSETTTSDTDFETPPPHANTGQRLFSLPEDIAPTSEVIALTAFHPHTSR